MTGAAETSHEKGSVIVDPIPASGHRPLTFGLKISIDVVQSCVMWLRIVMFRQSETEKSILSWC